MPRTLPRVTGNSKGASGSHAPAPGGSEVAPCELVEQPVAKASASATPVEIRRKALIPHPSSKLAPFQALLSRGPARAGQGGEGCMRACQRRRLKEFPCLARSHCPAPPHVLRSRVRPRGCLVHAVAGG